jgi:hypothetical protein
LDRAKIDDPGRWHAGDRESGVPARRPSAHGRVDRLRVQSAASENPCDHCVRIPHIAGVQFVASPDGRGDLFDGAELAPGGIFVVGEMSRAVDRFGDVRDAAVAPEANLVAEQAEASRPLGADGTFRDHPAVRPAEGWHRRLLDDVRRLW